MRVAFVAAETTKQRDTAGARRFERLARQLSDAGHDVTVFCAQWWTQGPPRTELEGVNYCGVTDGIALPAFCTRLPYLLARHNPDVVHVRPAPPEPVAAAAVGSTIARAPLVAEWFGDEGVDPDARATRLAARTPELVVTPSELVRTRVRELGATGERSRVVPESIDFGAIEDAGVADTVDVAYAHRLDGSANLESLLLALAELRDREWSATVVGDGSQRGAYERQAADLRIDDRVTFVGACDRAARLRIYRGAHAFVQTAYREYFATELLWALACGCVGVVEYQAESSAHELIESYERSFRATDPQQIADAIRAAGEFDRRTVDDAWESYDHGAILDRYVDAYERLVADYGYL
jgi:glycosyltransferase involved in cell wall biosynthesis